MSVTITSTEQIGPTSWLLRWESTEASPTYYIYEDGALAATTTREWWQFDVEQGEQLQVEILDAPGTPQTAYPGRVILTWLPVDDALRYRVEEYSGGEWVARRTINDAIATGYAHITDLLTDETAHQWRVVPVGETEIDGAQITFDIAMVRRPDPVEVEYEYSALTSKVTITEA